MERALRIYNGKALINSVNGKKEVMDQIFPLVAKYGGVVVGLCLDEDGIPETAEGRIAVGRKIIKTAASYGIGPEDIILDGLCMTVSSDNKGALTTLESSETDPGRAGRQVCSGRIQYLPLACLREKS